MEEMKSLIEESYWCQLNQLLSKNGQNILMDLQELGLVNNPEPIKPGQLLDFY